MPRSARFLLSHSYYHVMARGNNRHDIFKSPEDYQYFLQLIGRFKSELPFNLFHYSLMPNHIHFLVRTLNADDFSVFMKKISLAYFYHYKKIYGWVGHFWQGRFKSQPVGKDSYFIQCGKYIELNAVRKGLADDPKEYAYSSYRFYAFGENNPLVEEDIFYSELGETAVERQKSYKDLLIDDLIGETYLKQAWGSECQRHNEREKIRYHSKDF